MKKVTIVFCHCSTGGMAFLSARQVALSIHNCPQRHSGEGRVGTMPPQPHRAPGIRRDAVFAKTEAICHFSVIQVKFLSTRYIQRNFTSNNLASFRRNACFCVLSSPGKNAHFLHLSKNWLDYTHSSAPCPVKISINDIQAKSTVSHQSR